MRAADLRRRLRSRHRAARQRLLPSASCWAVPRSGGGTASGAYRSCGALCALSAPCTHVCTHVCAHTHTLCMQRLQGRAPALSQRSGPGTEACGAGVKPRPRRPGRLRMSGRELGEAAGLLCGAGEPLSGWAGPGLGPSHITTRRAYSPPLGTGPGKSVIPPGQTGNGLQKRSGACPQRPAAGGAAFSGPAGHSQTPF